MQPISVNFTDVTQVDAYSPSNIKISLTVQPNNFIQIPAGYRVYVPTDLIITPILQTASMLLVRGLQVWYTYEGAYLVHNASSQTATLGHGEVIAYGL